MKISKRLLSTAVIAIMVISFLVIMPVGATVVVAPPPQPVQAWNWTTDADVTDIAVGDLNRDGKDDVVAIDNFMLVDTLHAIAGEGPGAWNWQDTSMSGYAVAVGNIDKESPGKEVIAGGWVGTDKVYYGGNPEVGFEGRAGIDGAYVLNAYDKDGNVLWSYPVTGEVKDIEIGDVDGDGTDDVVACNTFASCIYAINGAGDNITGWPIITGTPILDLAVGQLDGKDGVDVAAIGGAFACLRVYNSTGDEMWRDDDVDGRAVEIGDVDGDGDNEVVAVTYASSGDYDGGLEVFRAEGRGNPLPYGGWVLAFDGDDGGEPLYSFYTEDGKFISDIELGDLDGNTKDVEVAAITEPTDATLFAIDIDAAQEMWRYSIDWRTRYYGESLAIGDVDRDYNNEVIAAGEVTTNHVTGYAILDCPYGVYAFDGLDRDGDGQGDLVWSPYCVWEEITDVEVGDLDGDGDDDVAFGTSGRRSVYALAAVESKTGTATGTGTVYFDSDPSTLEGLTPVSESDLPEEGKPDLEFPHGFFSFNITLPSANHTSAIVTMTFPSPLPVGTQYWKYGPTPSNPTDHWYQLPIGDDDGDKVITITLVDGGLGDDNVVAPDVVIVDQGGPGIPRAPVGGEAYPTSKISLLAPWIGLAVLLGGAGAFMMVRRKRTAP